jgi:hypothetical protein
MVKKRLEKEDVKKSDKNDLNYLKRRKLRIILDAVLFVIILMSLSLTLLFVSSEFGEDIDYYVNYHETDEYIEYSTQTILDSTVPRVTYHDINHQKTELIGQSVETLIIQDLNIRSSGGKELNETSLEQSIEHAILTAFNQAFENDKKFILTAGKFKQKPGADDVPELEIVITNSNIDLDLENSEEFLKNHEPIFEKFIENINIDNNPASDIVVIKLYLL